MVALTVAGCAMVGPEYEEPAAPLAEAWRGRDDERVRVDVIEADRWWASFDDPVLDALIDQAHRENRTLEGAALRVVQAQALRGIAFGGLFPQSQTLNAMYRRAHLSGNRSQQDFDQESTVFDTNLQAAWEIDLWGRLRRAIEAADASLLANLAEYDEVLVSLIGDVASTYVRIRVLEERLALARDNVRVQREGLDLARVRYEAGGTSELDVQQAETLLADTEAILPQLEIELRRSEHALTVLLGIPPGGVESAIESSLGIPAAPSSVAVGIPADLLRRRPDVRRAERRLAEQSARIGIAKADLFPKLTIAGTVGLRSENASDWFTSGSFEATGGPTIEWPVLNYGRLINAVRVQDARFQELVAAYEQSVLLAQQEVEDALVGYTRGIRQVANLARSVAAANRAVEISLIQYREGAADYTRVLTSQQSKLQEEDELATTRGNVTLSVIALYKAFGGGWELRDNDALVPADTREQMKQRTWWGGMLEPTSDEGEAK